MGYKDGAWTRALRGLSDLLASAGSLYLDHCAAEEAALAEASSTAVDSGAATSDARLSFKAFFTQGIQGHTASILQHGRTLCRDLPSSCLSPEQRALLDQLLEAVPPLQQLAAIDSLSEDNLYSRYPEAASANGDGSSSRRTAPTSNADEAAFGSLCEAVQTALAPVGSLGLQLVSKESLEDLCLKGALQVFSTVSQAGSQLVQRNRLAFDLVIVDEAAQLAEAETGILLQVGEVTVTHVQHRIHPCSISMWVLGYMCVVCVLKRGDVCGV